MYIHLNIVWRGLRESLLRRPFRLRRWLCVGFYSTLFLLTWTVVAVGRALDHLLFPGFKRQAIERPVFIVAPPRSGTTITQKLLARDEENFVHVKLYHTIFPCVTFYKIFALVGWIDDRLNGAVMGFAHWLEGRFFGGWEKTHPLRFTEPEEDNGFFVYPALTEAIYLLFPYVDAMWEAGFNDALPPAQRRKLMRYYRSCLQRHLYANGRGRTLLSKSTQLSGALEGLIEEFPDARIITLRRDPAQSIASHVSVFFPFWQRHSPEIAQDSPESHAYARLAAEWYKHLHAFRERLPEDQFLVLRYADLTADYQGTIEGIYNWLGLTLSDAGRDRLREATEQASSFRSRHEYRLEDFGLDHEWLREQLGPVLDTYKADSSGEHPAGKTSPAQDEMAEECR